MKKTVFAVLALTFLSTLSFAQGVMNENSNDDANAVFVKRMNGKAKNMEMINPDITVEMEDAIDSKIGYKGCSLNPNAMCDEKTRQQITSGVTNAVSQVAGAVHEHDPAAGGLEEMNEDAKSGRPLNPDAMVYFEDSAAKMGNYNGCTPNPFALCSGGRPSKKSGMRGCFDSVCPK